MDEGTRRTVTIEVDEELVSRAQAAGLDVASVTARALRDEISRRRDKDIRRDADELREGVRPDVEWYNGYSAKHGLFADRWRRF